MAVHTRAPQVEDLLGSLGVQPERCMAFTLECRPGNVVLVTVELLIEKGELETLTNTIKQHYKLVPVEAPDGV